MNKAKILLIEDERDISDLVRIQLELQGHSITSIANGSEAISIIQNQEFDLFIIDRMLPGTPGIDICKFIRNFTKTKRNPILFLTALSSPQCIIEGLDAGADDYMTKPFEMEVLLARTKALLRRYSQIKAPGQSTELAIMSIGPLSIDFDKCQVMNGLEKVALTASEFKILCLLAKSSGKVLGRRELVNNIQGENIHVTERTIDTHISSLRKKIGEAANVIETIRGIGYRVNTGE